MDEKPYNPLDYDNLTMNLVRELMSRGPYALPIPEPFIGPGVYALFYKGNFEHYTSLRSPKADLPIYVGKAEPPGGRKGIVENAEMSRALFGRIKEHCDSISATKNLKIEDFLCRYLVVVPLWITMAERFLIEHYRPVWNLCLDGFGNHHPGKHRFDGEISSWDLMHPGRQWRGEIWESGTEPHALIRTDQDVAMFQTLNQRHPLVTPTCGVSARLRCSG